MATVLRCDICGKIYEQYPMRTTDQFMHVQVLKKNVPVNGTYGCDEHDYCPECTKDILKLVDIMETSWRHILIGG